LSNVLSQDQGAMMFSGQGVETTQVSIPNNVRTEWDYTAVFYHVF